MQRVAGATEDGLRITLPPPNKAPDSPGRKPGARPAGAHCWVSQNGRVWSCSHTWRHSTQVLACPTPTQAASGARAGLDPDWAGLGEGNLCPPAGWRAFPGAWRALRPRLPKAQRPLPASLCWAWLGGPPLTLHLGQRWY